MLVDWFKTDVLVNQGNSGGAAVSDKGELIGVPRLGCGTKPATSIYFIRPSNSAVSLIQRAMRAEKASAASAMPRSAARAW